MRGALIHGALLVVMLVYGYRTWTRDKTVQPNIGSVVLWDRTEAELASIEYKADAKTVKLERKGDGPDAYWWGTETTITKVAKPLPKDAGSGAKPVEEEVKKTKEFPIADAILKDMITGWAAARAQTDLGKLDDAKKKEYKLDTAKTTLTVAFKGGAAKTFLVGGGVFQSADKYVVDTQSNVGYVLSTKLVSGLEQGESGLRLTDPRGFDVNKIDAIVVEANGQSKRAKRMEQPGAAEGSKVKVWGDGDTGKGDQTLANFVDKINNLHPTEYASTLDAKSLQVVLRLIYKDDKGAQLGTLVLYKHLAMGDLAPGEELDPAAPPKGKTEYYILTERMRVPGLVPTANAEPVETDVPLVFSADHPTEAPAPKVPTPPALKLNGSGSSASP
jgi:hypothetical protein